MSKSIVWGLFGAGAAIVIGGGVYVLYKNHKKSSLPTGLSYGSSAIKGGAVFDTFVQSGSETDMKGVCGPIGSTVGTGYTGVSTCKTPIGPASTLGMYPVSVDDQGVPEQCAGSGHNVPVGFMREVDCKAMGGTSETTSSPGAESMCWLYSCPWTQLTSTNGVSYLAKAGDTCPSGGKNYGIRLPNVSSSDCAKLGGGSISMVIPGVSGEVTSCLLSACRRKS